eukprot:s5085_g4.t1
MQNPPADSFFARFQAALRAYGWRWSDWSQLTARTGKVFELRGQLLETRRYAVRSALLCAQHAQQLTDCIAQMSLAHKSAMGGLRGPVTSGLQILRCQACGANWQKSIPMGIHQRQDSPSQKVETQAKTNAKGNNAKGDSMATDSPSQKVETQAKTNAKGNNAKGDSMATTKGTMKKPATEASTMKAMKAK